MKSWRCPVCGADVVRDLPNRCLAKNCPPVPAGALDQPPITQGVKPWGS